MYQLQQILLPPHWHTVWHWKGVFIVKFFLNQGSPSETPRGKKNHRIPRELSFIPVPVHIISFPWSYPNSSRKIKNSHSHPNGSRGNPDFPFPPYNFIWNAFSVVFRSCVVKSRGKVDLPNPCTLKLSISCEFCGNYSRVCHVHEITQRKQHVRIHIVDRGMASE